MLSPNQIKMQSFSPSGRGAYKAAEVDSFMQKVYVSYTELISENSTLKKKFASLSSIIEEYNAGKNAIATALVKAQTVADQTIASANAAAEEILNRAKAKADSLIGEKTQEAEEYAKEKKQTADEYFAKAETELQKIMAQAEAESAKYAEEINAKAEKIIAEANEKASKIVSAAFVDAKEYRKKADDIISKAKVEVETTKNSVAFFKENTMSVLSQLIPLLEQINMDEFVEPEITDFENETSKSIEPVEVSKFELPELFEEEKNEAVLPEVQADETADIEDEPQNEIIEIEEKQTEEAPVDDDSKLISDINDYVSGLFAGLNIPSSDTFYFDDESPETSDETSTLNVKDNPDEQKPVLNDTSSTGGNFKFRLTKNFDIFED